MGSLSFTRSGMSSRCQGIDELRALAASQHEELQEKASLIELQSQQLEQLRQELQEAKLTAQESLQAAEKLEAAVLHRDGVIAALASSRKLVFEECHRISAHSQAEIRQMQDALHRVSRQLSLERRDQALRMRELRKQLQASRRPCASTSFSSPSTSVHWDPEASGVDDDDLTIDANDISGLVLEGSMDDSSDASEGVEAASAPLPGAPASPRLVRSNSDDIDFLTW